MKCKSCSDTGLVRQGVCIKQCENCDAFARVTEDAIADAQVELGGDSNTVRLLRAENDTAARRVRELEGIIEHGASENKRQHAELVELRENVQLLAHQRDEERKRAEAAERDYAELKASNAETARTTDAGAQRKAK